MESLTIQPIKTNPVIKDDPTLNVGSETRQNTGEQLNFCTES